MPKVTDPGAFARLYAPVAGTSEQWVLLDTTAWLQAMERNFAELKACDDEAAAAGRLTGRYFYQSVADGRAFYQIVRENKKTVRIRHCEGVAGDDYQVNLWGWEASIPTTLAQRLVNQRVAMAKLFSGGGL